MNRRPLELVVEILSRLPLITLVQSKSVCRAWRILIQDQFLLNKHFKHMVNIDPSFIYHPFQNQLYFGDLSSDPNDGNMMMITKKLALPPLHNFQLVCSCNGLLCLRATHPSFQLGIYNPFTRNYIELPILSHRSGVIGFGFDPLTQKYKVVEISSKRTCIGILRRIRHVMRQAAPIAASSSTSSVESIVRILNVGSPEWRNLGSFPFHFMRQASQVLVNGRFHWIVTDLIMSFDLATELVKEIPMPDFITSDRQFHELVVLRGCLSAVSFDEDNKELEIWIMKEYDVKQSWVKEFSIGAYVPKVLQLNDERHSRSYLSKRWIRVLCLLRNGEILLQYRSKAVFLYDPNGIIPRSSSYIPRDSKVYQGSRSCFQPQLDRYNCQFLRLWKRVFFYVI